MQHWCETFCLVSYGNNSIVTFEWILQTLVKSAKKPKKYRDININLDRYYTWTNPILKH